MVGYCCLGFSRLLDTGSCKGFSLFVEERNGEPVFWLQFRSIDRGTALPKSDTPGQLILATETRLLFCPWCGNNLAAYYSESWNDLKLKTAALHLDFDIKAG